MVEGKVGDITGHALGDVNSGRPSKRISVLNTEKPLEVFKQGVR